MKNRTIDLVPAHQHMLDVSASIIAVQDAGDKSVIKRTLDLAKMIGNIKIPPAHVPAVAENFAMVVEKVGGIPRNKRFTTKERATMNRAAEALKMQRLDNTAHEVPAEVQPSASPGGGEGTHLPIETVAATHNGGMTGQSAHAAVG